MDNKYITENLEKKSNSIVGFVVLQSIYFANQLANEDFTAKIHMINGLYNYLFFAHCLIFLIALVFLKVIDKRLIKYLDDEVKEVTFPHSTLIVKMCVMILFGLIPIIIFINHFIH